jgi:tryptophan synthase alpha chain
MERIRKVFDGGCKALIVYLTAGFPEPGADEDLALAVIDSGADILELGFPFSDPVADGPLIQKASERALENGMTLAGTIELAGRIRKKRETPILLMGYVNPVYHMGYKAFAKELSRVGGDGAIIPDLPFDAAGPLRDEMRKNGLALIPMAAPNTPEDRLGRIIGNGDGFLYLVSMAGLTGDAIKQDAPWKKTAALARSRARLPVCIGFGIRTPADAASALEACDGVVVGTAVTARILDAPDIDQARNRVGGLVKELAKAVGKG